MPNFTENIANLTPVFRNAVEAFIPQWLNSQLPYYREAIARNVDIMEMANVIGCNGQHYVSDGVYYYYSVNGSGLKVLSLDGSNNHYTRTGFRECIIEMFPNLDVSPNPDMGKFSELFKNSIYFDYYLWRMFNRKSPYDDLNNKIDAYFKQLTGDDNVGFSLSSTSMLYFNPRAKMYINNNCSFW